MIHAVFLGKRKPWKMQIRRNTGNRIWLPSCFLLRLQNENNLFFAAGSFLDSSDNWTLSTRR